LKYPRALPNQQTPSFSLKGIRVEALKRISFFNGFTASTI